MPTRRLRCLLNRNERAYDQGASYSYALTRVCAESGVLLGMTAECPWVMYRKPLVSGSGRRCTATGIFLPALPGKDWRGFSLPGSRWLAVPLFRPGYRDPA